MSMPSARPPAFTGTCEPSGWRLSSGDPREGRPSGAGAEGTLRARYTSVYAVRRGPAALPSATCRAAPTARGGGCPASWPWAPSDVCGQQTWCRHRLPGLGARPALRGHHRLRDSRDSRNRPTPPDGQPGSPMPSDLSARTREQPARAVCARGSAIPRSKDNDTSDTETMTVPAEGIACSLPPLVSEGKPPAPPQQWPSADRKESMEQRERVSQTPR